MTGDPLYGGGGGGEPLRHRAVPSPMPHSLFFSLRHRSLTVPADAQRDGLLSAGMTCFLQTVEHDGGLQGSVSLPCPEAPRYHSGRVELPVPHMDGCYVSYRVRESHVRPFLFSFFFLRESDISLVNLGLAGVDIVWNFLRSSRPTGGGGSRLTADPQLLSLFSSDKSDITLQTSPTSLSCPGILHLRTRLSVTCLCRSGARWRKGQAFDMSVTVCPSEILGGSTPPKR